jgi:hypothetical protein
VSLANDLLSALHIILTIAVTTKGIITVGGIIGMAISRAS